MDLAEVGRRHGQGEIALPLRHGTTGDRHRNGIAVIDANTPDSNLDAMNTAGVCGIRLNLATGGTSDPSVARQRLGVDQQDLQSAEVIGGRVSVN